MCVGKPNLSFLLGPLSAVTLIEGLTGPVLSLSSGQTPQECRHLRPSVWGRLHATTLPPLAFHAKSSSLAL